MTDRWQALEGRMNELRDLDDVIAVLSWDEETYAPPGGRAARGGHTATVEAVRHQRLVDPALGELIDGFEADASLETDRKIAVKRLKRRRDLAVKVPESLVKELARARSSALEAWQRAKKSNEFSVFEPHLTEILRLTRQKAEALEPATGLPYDAMLDEHEPEMTTSALRPVLAELREGLVPLVERIVGTQKRPDTHFLSEQRYPDAAQWDFTMRLLKDLGFDFANGRQDRSAHPFTQSCAERDVRLTTQIHENNLLSALFSTIHECGHGLYEQGFDPKFYRTYVAMAPSMGIHESQSRLWENIVGRSRPFWQHYLPELKKVFPEQLEKVDLDAFHRAVNLVEPSLIRTESDEVTYNLHILVRFELELAMFAGDLEVSALPEAWNQRMEEYLGVRPPTDAKGCMQDIHWAFGAFGYFPTYSIGNLYSAQLMDAYQKAHPGIWDDVAAGQFEPLLTWLREKIHRRGHTASADEIVRDATGQSLSVKPFLAYLEKKFGALYGI